MLTGTSLINKVIELADQPKATIVETCGYATVTKAGKQKLNYTDFYMALLSAKGVA
jgi:hypothetical protein